MICARSTAWPSLPGWIWLIPPAAMACLFAVLQSGPGNSAANIAWYSALILIAATALTWACRIEKKLDLFEPLYLVFGLFAVSYPVRAILALWSDDDWFDPAKAPLWRALSASVLGFAAFALGYKFAPGKGTVWRRIWLDRNWNIERAQVASLVLLLLGIGGFLAMRLLGGSFLYFMTLDPDIKSPQEIKAWFYYLFWMCLLLQVGALIQFGVWLSTRRRTLRTAFYCLLALASGFLLARLYTVFCLMMLTLSWHYMKRRIRPLQIATLFFLVVIYLAIAGFYRDWFSPGVNLEATGELVELAGEQDKLLLRYVVANLEELDNLSEVMSITPSELPYQFGGTFTPVIFKPIPRTLMPSKPLGASALFWQHADPNSYDNGFVTALGAWAEWYLNFSWAGLVFGFALTGALSAAAYRAMRAAAEFGRVLLYASFVVLLLVWLRNDFNSAVTLGLYYFIPTILALAYIASGDPKPSSLSRRSRTK